VTYGLPLCACCGSIDGVERHRLYLHSEGCLNRPSAPPDPMPSLSLIAKTPSPNRAPPGGEGRGGTG
jgi:hypothetical protein